MSPGFTVGYSPEQMDERLNSEIYRLSRSGQPIVSMMFDGSSHDSHQHYSLIEAVDNVYLNKTSRHLGLAGYSSDVGRAV